MKLKQLPEDFAVEELNKFELKESGNYKLYLLEKKSMETFYLLSYLSKKNNIPVSEFGIAGLKDKHAVTKQYLTIPKKYDIKTIKEQNFSLNFLGFVSEQLKSGDLQGNKFTITVRDVKKGEVEGIINKSKAIDQGMPNYFDSQRFGSVLNREFIAKYLIKKDYEKAVKLFLTETSKFEKADVKKDKKKILENWEFLSKISIKIKTFRIIIEEFLKTKDWLKAYKKIPNNLREIYISAYQSYLWNECVKELLRQKIDKKRLYSVKYNIGSLEFYKSISEEEKKSLPETFKTISHDIKPTETEKKIIEKILAREEIKIEDFDIRQQTDSFFKSHERKVIIFPGSFSISEPQVDELNDKGKNNRFKFIVSFSMSKGSYATIATKRLFNQ
jgi:tRNA pseudouridine13 synthase